MERAGLTAYAGGYVPKNTGRTPYVWRTDLRVEQEIPGFSSEQRGIFYFEILNLLQLINKNSGKVLDNQFRTSQRSLVCLDSIDPVTGQYVYDLPFRGFNTDANYDQFVAEESQWRLKVGVRYRF